MTVLLPRSHPAGLCVLADTLHPGWRAWVNRNPAAIVPVDGAFRGVFVAAGDSSVRFRYEPESWRIGLYISLVAAGILTATFAAGVAGTTRRPHPNVPRNPAGSVAAASVGAPSVPADAVAAALRGAESKQDGRFVN